MPLIVTRFPLQVHILLTMKVWNGASAVHGVNYVSLLYYFDILTGHSFEHVLTFEEQKNGWERISSLEGVHEAGKRKLYSAMVCLPSEKKEEKERSPLLLKHTRAP